MTLDRYRPVRKLEGEATTDSFLAQQVGLAGIERLVVLERLRPELRNDAHYVQLFFEGVRATGQLRHPRIVETLDVGHERDVYYFVTEYVRGESLYAIQRLLRDPVPLPVALQIGQDLAAALAHAHAATDLDGHPLDVVHGEVTPRRIVVGYDGATKLGGFGLARANAHHVYARPDDLRHKLSYSSPERIRYEPATPASDVFSLGVVLHELLTGERLFRGRTPSDVIKSVMEKEIPLPSSVEKSVPKEVDTIVMGALERDPERRTPTAERLFAELRQAAPTLGLVAGTDDVGEWLRAALPESHQRRLEVEREALAHVLARDLADASDVAPLVMGGLLDVGSSGMGSVPSGVVVQKPSRTPWFVVGALAFVLLLGTAFFIGMSGEEEPVASLAAPRSGVSVFTAPPGATISVDGALVAQAVGPEGVFIATGERDTVTIEATLEGHETTRQPVQMPVEGRRALRLALAPLSDVMVAVADAVIESGEGGADPGRGGVAVAGSGPSGGDRGARRAGGRSGPAPRTAAAAVTTRGATTRGATTGPVTGRLTIHFAPQTATIAVNGVEVAGRSPLTVPDLDPGSHTVRASAPGHTTLTRSASVEPGATRDVHIELTPGAPRVATLDLVTMPAGGRVSIDGRARGTAPLRRVELDPDREYRISVTLEGYRPWSARVTPVAGTNPPLVASLTPAPVEVAPAQPSPVAHHADIRIPAGTTGDASAGQGLFAARCGSCHGRSAPAISARRYTQEQWSRYFATGRHGRHAPLREHFGASQLADVKAYLVEHAADVETARAAGVR